MTISVDEDTVANILARRCAEHMWANDRASEHLGMAIESVAEGRAVLTMSVRENMVNGHDICHGGLIFALADSAFAFACNSQNHTTVAAGATIDFLRPAQQGDWLTAIATVVHQGGRNGIYDVVVTNQKDQVIAQFRGRSSRIKGAVIADGGAGEA